VLRNFLQRWRIILADRIRFSKSIRRILFQWEVLRGGGRSSSTAQRLEQIGRLCAAARLAATPRQILAVEARMKAIAEKIDLVEASPFLIEEPGDLIRKAAILKPYDESTGEKGAIFISFEFEWAMLLAARNRDEFARRYQIIVSPTWTPPHSRLNLLFPRIWPEPVYCLISNETDLETFPRLSENYRMVNLYASSWVNPDLFHPRPRDERDIDLIMLANFGIYKRHHVLFRALRDLQTSWRVVLVGQPNGDRTEQKLMAEAEAFGVRDRIELRQRISDEEVCDLLCRSRISLICSKREGSCVAVVESMFADTPVVLLEGAQVGSAKFINPETGAFFEERRLAENLSRTMTIFDQMCPRNWCLEHGLSAAESSRILNERLRDDVLAKGMPWSRDLLPLHWRPDPEPLRETPSWILDEQRRIAEFTGIFIGKSADSAAMFREMKFSPDKGIL
jgi:glycosyltransferase involved in cell wall biosynthesis